MQKQIGAICSCVEIAVAVITLIIAVAGVEAHGWQLLLVFCAGGFLGSGIASLFLLFLHPAIRRALEKEDQKEAYAEYLLLRDEFMRDKHFIASSYNHPLLLNKSGQHLCPYCAERLQETVVPDPDGMHTSVICPKCGNNVIAS